MPSQSCFFVSDLHGSRERYGKLFAAIETERPGAVLMGGDLLPSAYEAGLSRAAGRDDFLDDFLIPALQNLLGGLGSARPRVLLILGNDDPRAEEARLQAAAEQGLFEYLHMRRTEMNEHPVFGYACVPPTPFMLKDWERYDVSRYVDPGSVSPEEGYRTVAVAADEQRHRTITADLESLVDGVELDDAVFLFHSPPYQSKLDRAGLDGQFYEHVPLDVHVGSIAIQRFIEEHQPLLSLHGHIHESARLTGAWRQRFGRTHAFSAAHDGPELALVRFELDDLESASRELI